MPTPDQRPKPGFGRTAPLPRVANDLRARYGLAPQPVHVEKISSLAAKKNSSSMEEIVQIINPDRQVTERLVNLAFTRPAAREGATVQMATSRLGMNRVIVVMIGDLLKHAVIETFNTMFNIELNVEDANALPMGGIEMWTGSVKFTGQNNGEVTLAFSRPLSLYVVASLMGGSLDDQYPAAVISDAVGEIVNMVTGNLQSRLADAGFPSDVEVPNVRMRSSLPKDTIPGGTSDQYYFRTGIYRVGVDLSIAPFTA
jgi:CheY-specific phosphatase CheX